MIGYHALYFCFLGHDFIFVLCQFILVFCMSPSGYLESALYLTLLFVLIGKNLETPRTMQRLLPLFPLLIEKMCSIM